MKSNMKKYQYGFSLVELMVGSVISLLVTLTVAGSSRFLDTQKKITVGTNVVLENLSLAHREVSNTLKMASYGTYGCVTTNIQESAVAGGKAVTVNDLSQMFITSNNVTTNNSNIDSDAITLLHGDSDTGNAYTVVSNLSSNSITTTDYAGQLKLNQLVVVRSSTPPNPATTCSVSKVTSLTPITVIDASLNFTTFPITGNNPSAITGLSDILYSKLFIKDNNLRRYNSIIHNSEDDAEILAENIVYMKAYYGLINGTFVSAISTGNWATHNLISGRDSTNTSIVNGEVYAIRSMRIFMVARAPVLNKKEKNSSGDMVCTATDDNHKVIKSWTGGPEFNVTTLIDGQCYKYKAIEFIAPLKNKVLFDI